MLRRRILDNVEGQSGVVTRDNTNMMRGFDSIESMNGEELLVKRKRGSKKYLIVFGTVCAASVLVGFLIGYFSHSDGCPCFNASIPDSGPNRFNTTHYLIENISKSKIQETLRRYSKEPRLAGTILNDELAEMIADDWQKNGLEDVHLDSYHVLLSFPNISAPNVIQLIDPKTGETLFQTDPFEKVLTSNENNPHVVPPFNAYSPSGDVLNDLVYVNYGTIEDFDYLTSNMSVNLTGTIVIARYGKIYRGDKVRNAERFQAAGIILYSDPHDYNMDSTQEPYPKSWWLPSTGIQRGSISDDGDPLTPFYPSTDYAQRVDLNSTKLPRIPCQPIGYTDAQKLLGRLGGHQAPDDWQGKLNFTYHIGPGFMNEPNIKVRLNVNNYMEIRPIHNVIGYIRGSEEPDRYVLMGNHHDAWVFGAVDPLSGSAALTEISRVYGELLRKGHRPRRTVIFCSWDAEEYGLTGSTEWVEEHLHSLNQRAVAYLNMDFSAVGNFTLAVSTTPLLQNLLYSSAKKVPSPDPVADSLYGLWKLRPIRKGWNCTDPYISYSLGSGSDMAPFYQRAGVPSVDMWMTFDEIKMPLSSYPLYHSSYETFYAFDNFIDPGFLYTKAITQFMAVVACELANADLLPLSVERYTEAVEMFFKSLMENFGQVWQENDINVDIFQSAVRNFTSASQNFQEQIKADKTLYQNPLKMRLINDRMMMLERAFLDPEGLPGRRRQKHVIFAPSQFDAYRDSTFPGIRDTMFEIEHGNDHWEQLRQQIFIVTYFIQAAAASLLGIGL